MSIETDLYSTLSNAAGVTALVSTRIYPQIAPESAAYPYCTYQLISADRVETLPGTGNARRARIQVSCHSTTYSSAKAVSAAVIAALEGNGYLDLEYDLYDPSTQVHTCIVDWAFMSVT